MKMLIIYYSLQPFDLDTDLINTKDWNTERRATESISHARARPKIA